jgi:hypothetical protein
MAALPPRRADRHPPVFSGCSARCSTTSTCQGCSSWCVVVEHLGVSCPPRLALRPGRPGASL